MTIDRDRRRTVAGLAAGTALVLTGCAGGREKPQALRFEHGVASGDPTENSAVLWTRLSGVTSDTPVNWELAHDRKFSRLAGRGEAAAPADRDFTVKVEVTGLESGTRYFYRFRAGTTASPVGRTRTLPAGTVAAVGFAVSVGQYPPTLLVGAGRVQTLTTEAVALASGGDRRVIGVYALTQALAALLPFLLAIYGPRLMWRHRAGLRDG